MAMTIEHRRAISEAQRARHARARAASPEVQEFTKRCTQCTQRRVVRLDGTGDFYIRKVKRRFGIVRQANPECKDCSKERRREWKAAKTPEEMTAFHAKWNSGRDRDKRRKYQREYERMRRRLRGDPERGFWLKYRHEALPSKEIYVDPKPFCAWLEEWLAVTGTSDKALGNAALGKDGARTLFRIRYESKTCSLYNLDRLAVAMGMPDQISVLYPVLPA